MYLTKEQQLPAVRGGPASAAPNGDLHDEAAPHSLLHALPCHFLRLGIGIALTAASSLPEPTLTRLFHLQTTRNLR